MTQFAVMDTLTLSYFRYQPGPKKYIDEGYAPLYARVRFMFGQLKNKNNCVFMDYLYMSALFARRVMGSDNCVKIHGVTRREGKGTPNCVQQYEVQDETALYSV